MIFGKIKSLLAVLALALLLAPAAQAAPAKLSSAWMGEHETFVAWYAKQQGWDKEAGLDLTMMPFDSGKNIVESLAAYDWAVAGCGAVPALTTPLSDYLYIIAVANDESANNAIYVRKDSPILGAKGTNPSYPNVYGSAVTVQKADILYPKSTSAHYLLATWLRILGLSEFLSPDSGIVQFMSFFDIYKTEEGDGDLWRIYNREYDGNPEALPEETTIQRGYKKLLLSGGHAGYGEGIFFRKKKEML